MATRNPHWSDTKLADWIRGGDKKPSAETTAGWNDWRTATKAKHPIRYWIAEEGLDYVQNAIFWPIDVLHTIKYYLLNRFVTKTHALTSNLPRGQWAELDTRLLHCAFDELVNFVEVDKAWMNIVFSDADVRKKYNAGFFASGWWRLRTWRCPEAGLDHLRWETKLVCDEDAGYSTSHPDFGKPTQQAITAQELLALYFWWKVERPNRPDPIDGQNYQAIMDAERKQDEEDTAMLVSLVKLRQSLWT